MPHQKPLSLLTPLPALISLMMLLLLAGCSEKPPKTEDIRPVRAMVVAPAGARQAVELAGEVLPRYESRLGFRVGGNVIARRVDVGTVVKRGQLLMQLDASDFQLAQAQAKAGVSAADSTLALAQSELNRYSELRQKNFVSQAVLESKEAAYKAALATHEQATVGLRVQANQSSYASLVADADGVVTGIDAEVGQVVSAGMPVVRIARTGEKEVRVSIPEDQVAKLKRISDVLGADMGAVASGDMTFSSVDRVNGRRARRRYVGFSGVPRLGGAVTATSAADASWGLVARAVDQRREARSTRNKLSRDRLLLRRAKRGFQAPGRTHAARNFRDLARGSLKDLGRAKGLICRGF